MSDFQRMSSMENLENYRGKSALTCYKDTLKASLKDFDIPVGSGEQTAQGRSKWRGLINKGEKKESVKLKESAENAKPTPMDHQLIS